MGTLCAFCHAPLPESPAGALIRCASCGGLTPTPAAPPAGGPQIPPTVALMPPPPPPTPEFGPSIKGAASPPPANPGVSTAGGMDEIVGAGALIFGLITAKALVAYVVMLMLVLSCVAAMLAVGGLGLFGH